MLTWLWWKAGRWRRRRARRAILGQRDHTAPYEALFLGEHPGWAAELQAQIDALPTTTDHETTS